MGLIPTNNAVEVSCVDLAKLVPHIRIFLDDGCNNLVSLSKVIVQMNVGETLGNTSPSIYLLLRQSINVVGNFLVRNKKKVHLSCTTSITFLSEILKHLRITYGSLRNICFKELAKLIVNYIYACISFTSQTFYHAFVEFNNIETEEGIKYTTCGKSRINTLKLLISNDVIIVKFRNKLSDRHIQRIF